MVTCCSYLWGSWTVTKLFISLHTPLSVSRSLSAFLITQYFSFVLSFPLSASPFLSASLQWSIHFPLSLLFHPSSLSSAYHIQLLHPCPILLFDPVRNLFGCKQIVEWTSRVWQVQLNAPSTLKLYFICCMVVDWNIYTCTPENNFFLEFTFSFWM